MRYAYFDSHGDFNRKRAVLMACLQKVQNMASDGAALRLSASQKLAEFSNLRYPRKMLWTACTTGWAWARAIQYGSEYESSFEMALRIRQNSFQ